MGMPLCSLGTPKVYRRSRSKKHGYQPNHYAAENTDETNAKRHIRKLAAYPKTQHCT